MDTLITGGTMTIYKTAYDTTIGNAALIGKTVIAIKESVIKDSVHQITTEGVVNDEVPAFFIKGSYSSEDNIPFFHHPLIVAIRDSQNKQDRDYICSDLRMLISKRFNRVDNDGAHDFRIRNQADYSFNICRTVMNTIWISERPSVLRDISSIPCALYSSWISEALARRYALDAKDQMGLGVLAAIFYQSLFIDSDTISEDDKPKIAQAVMKATRAQSAMVFEYLDKIDTLSNVKDFCRYCSTLLENTRLEDFNEGILITVIGNTWFGINAKEVMAVALEHPPTWVSLAFFSFTERSYKNSTIAKIATRYLGNKGETDFVKAFSTLYQSHYVERQG